MYGVVREYQSPTGVTHAVRGRFGHGSNAWGVVFARKSTIELYFVRANTDTARLQLVQSTRIGAGIVSLATLRRAGDASDVLLVGFNKMHVVALTWDSSTLSWVLEQPFNLGSMLGRASCAIESVVESEEFGDPGRKLLRGKRGGDAMPIIRTDPSGRCTAILALGQDILYVIPLGADGSAMSAHDAFVIDLKSHKYEAANVKDFVFLQGTFEPSVVVLYEPKRTWAGRAATMRNTSHLLSISIDVRSRNHEKSWVMQKLPYDSLKLETVPESAEGGVLLLAPNVIMQVRHGAVVAGLSLNCFGDAYAAEMAGTYDSIRASDTLMALDASHCRFLDWEESGSMGKLQNTCLLSLKGGELYFLTLSSNNTLELQRAGSTVLASEIVPVNDRFFVLASRLSDSLLVEYQRTARDDDGEDDDSVKGMEGVAEDDADFEIYGLKRPDKNKAKDEAKNDSEETLELKEKDEGTRGVYDDEDELGWVFNKSAEDEEATKANIHAGKWQLKVKDTLACFGPGADVTLGRFPDRPQGYALDMVVAGGYAKNGCLAVVHQTVRPKDTTRFELKGCTGAWTVRDPSVIRRLAEERRERNKLISSRNESKRAINAKRLAARKRFVDEFVAKYVEAEVKKRNEAQNETKIKNEQDKSHLKDNEKSGEGKENVAEKAKIEETRDENVRNKENGYAEKDTPQISNGDVSSKKRKAEDFEVSSAENLKRPRKELETISAEGEPVKEDVKQVTAEDIEVPEKIIEEANGEADGEEKFQLEVEEAAEEDVEGQELLHAYMLLSTDANTLVLPTGNKKFDLVLDKSTEYVTDEMTLCAGNILQERVSVQVTKSRIRVLMEGKMQCEHVLPAEGPHIVDAQILEPIVLITTSHGRCEAFVLNAETYVEDDKKEETLNTPDEGDDDEDPMFGESPAKGMKKEEMKSAEGGGEGSVEKLRNFTIQSEFQSVAPTGSTQFVNCACLYHGNLSSQVVVGSQPTQSGNLDEITPSPADTTKEEQKVETEDVKDKQQDGDDMDEEDRMLYGDDVDSEEEMMLYGTAGGDDDTSKAKEKSGVETAKAADVSGDAKENEEKNEGLASEKGVLLLEEKVTKQHGVLLVLATKSGALEVRSAALNYAVILRCEHFFSVPPVVKDGGDLSDVKSKPRAPRRWRVSSLFLGDVQVSAEMPGTATPILVAINQSGLPMIYTAFAATATAPGTRSNLRFRRFFDTDRTASVFAKSIVRTNAIKKSNARAGANGGAEKETKHSSVARFSVSRFTNIAGRSGLFVAGPVPFFIFAERGYPRVHALYHKDATPTPSCILSFDELNIIECRGGFVTVADNGVVRIGQLAPPDVINYDTPSPMRKIALRCSPHKVAYHAGSATYGVMASMPTPTTRKERLDRILQSLEKHDKRHYQSLALQAETDQGDGTTSRVPQIFEELHELRIYRADSWEMIKSYKLEKGEVGLAIANMNVNVFKQRVAGPGVDIPSSHRGEDGNESLFAASIKMRPKNMLVVGTGFLNGEDATSKGRLLLFEVSRVDAQMGGGVHTAFQLQLIAQKELPSPVTSVASMEGYVICGVGPQVSVYKLVGDEIVHLAFAFGQLFCTTIATMKQYVVCGDIMKSVSFFYFRDRNSSVNFLGKDFEHVTTYAANFLLRHDEMSVVVTDERGNMHTLSYEAAIVPESRGGKRLLVRGGLNYGSQINKLVRVRDTSTIIQDSNSNRGAGRHALAFATLDGGIGMVVATDKKTFDTIKAVEEAINGAEIEKDFRVARYSGISGGEETRFEAESTATERLGDRLLDSRDACEILGLDALGMRRIAKICGHQLDDLVQAMTQLDGVLETLS